MFLSRFHAADIVKGKALGMKRRPLILGLGGTPKPNSSTERALEIALKAAARAGAETQIFGGTRLAQLPLYLTESAENNACAADFIDLVRAADGLIVASPSYHGTISGLIKNAIDHMQETYADDRPYLEGLPVGLILTAGGAQAIGSTLSTLRTMVHALRGWPTPFGAAVTNPADLNEQAAQVNNVVLQQLDLVGRQVATFASLQLADTSTYLESFAGGEKLTGTAVISN